MSHTFKRLHVQLPCGEAPEVKMVEPAPMIVAHVGCHPIWASPHGALAGVGCHPIWASPHGALAGVGCHPIWASPHGVVATAQVEAGAESEAEPAAIFVDARQLPVLLAQLKFQQAETADQIAELECAQRAVEEFEQAEAERGERG